MVTMSIPTQPAEAREAVDGTSLPRLVLEDLTGLEHLQYDYLDADLCLHHTVVVKVRYTLGAVNPQGLAPLVASVHPAALNDEDLPYSDTPDSSMRQESDLAPYKPYCDVLVVGAAHAPLGKAVPQFEARLQVLDRPRQAELPPRPQGLSPMQSPSPEDIKRWQREVAQAQARAALPVALVDKRLQVYGPRQWRRASVAPTLAKALTLGLASPSPWQLSAPEASASCPLQYELAFGGSCRINAGDAAARRVAKAHRLNATQLAQHPDADAEPTLRPVAHDASLSNPVGLGFARRWYLDATRADELPAHRLDRAAAPITGADFWRIANASANTSAQPLAPAGFSPVGRGWQPRAALVGKVSPGPDRIQAGLALNLDFDFRYWNCAPQDQQCRHLRGGEQIVLTNLFAPTHPGSRTVEQGSEQSSELRFLVPQRELVLMGINAAGEMQLHAPVIDTVLIDTEAQQVDICWRWRISQEQGLTHARLLEARTEGQRQRLGELRERVPSYEEDSADPPSKHKKGTQPGSNHAPKR
jgi:hypothetical protein